MVRAICVLVIIFVSVYSFKTTTANTRLKVEAPVSPVKYGGILSVHCQIWELQSDLHEVTISRQVGDQNPQRLSMGDVILVQDWEDRIFLAIRQLNDGTTVYFLSLTQVTREDAGRYSCEIFTDRLRHVIDDGQVEINVEYFPEEDPECSPPVSIDIHAGMPMEFSCSTADAYPGVTIQWTRTGAGMLPADVQTRHGGMVYSRLIYRPTDNDNGVMLFCQVSSDVFPDLLNKCHIGPITVIGSSVQDSGFNTVTKSPLDNGIANTVDTVEHGIIDNSVKAPSETAARCKHTCRKFDAESSFYWIISTVIIGSLAIIFALIGIIVAVKYNRMRRADYIDRSYTIRQCVPDSTYEIPVYTKTDNEVYMPLNKPVCRVDSKQFLGSNDDLGDVNQG